MSNLKPVIQQDFLDILFQDKNKLYGAYELRRKYFKRLFIALIVVCSVLALTFSSVLTYEKMMAVFRKNKKEEVKAVTLKNIKPPEEKIIEPPKPPPKPKDLKIKTVKATQFTAVDDNEAEEKYTITDLKGAQINTFSQEGVEDDGTIKPSDDGVGDGPDQTEEEPILEKVDQIAEFPGGAKAWLRYVEREIHKYIDELTDAGFSGTVKVQFIVDKQGRVSDVKAMTNPGTKLAEIAVEAIKRGPNWVPAMNNGKSVTSYRTQPVTFKLEEE